MHTWQLILGLIAAGSGAMAFADDFSFAKAPPVSDHALDEVRGGFETPANLRASLSLTRAAYVNGAIIVVDGGESVAPAMFAMI